MPARPSLGDVQPTLRRRDQRNGDQPVVQQQPQRRLLLQEMLVHQFTHRGADPLLIARAVGLEEIGKGRFVAVSVIQQRTGFAVVTTVERANSADIGMTTLGFS